MILQAVLAWQVSVEPPAAPAIDAPALREGFRARVSSEVRRAIDGRARYCEGPAGIVGGELAVHAANERRAALQRNNDAAGANALEDGAGTSTGAERLAAAVVTGLDGVEAGVMLSPLALIPSFAPRTPHGPSLLIAALGDGKLRAGAGYAVTVRQPTDAEASWRETACGGAEVTARITATVEEALDVTVEDAYVSACTEVIPQLDAYVRTACENPKHCGMAEARRRSLLAACGDSVDVQVLAGTLSNLLNDEQVTPGLRRALHRLAGPRASLEKAGAVLVAAKMGLDPEAFLQRYRTTQWTSVSVRLGVDGSADFARRQFGKRRLEAGDPGAPGTPEELDGGELLAWRVGPAVMLKAGRIQSSVGVNGGQAIPVGSTSMFTTLQPSASLSWLVAFFDDSRIDRSLPYGARVPTFDEDGKLPPHLVFGTRASLTVPITQPTFQDDALDAATVLVHADFVVSKTLKFRLGVPVSAKLVEQEANTDAEPDIPVRTVLRWTIPVFGTTVVAF